jgi:signal transduction histidine kinase
VVAVFSVGAHAEPRRAAAGCALVILTFWVGALQDNARHPGRRGPSDVVYITVLLGGAWLLGRALRQRGQRADQLERRAARLEAEQQARAQAAVAAERARIARELHDVIAHSVSVMVIQAGAAEQLLAQTPRARPRAADGGAGDRPADHHRAAPTARHLACRRAGGVLGTAARAGQP